MRIATHLATLAALITVGLALGRWLREPNFGGLFVLLVLVAVMAAALRHLYRPRRDVAAGPSPEPEPGPAAPAPAPEPPPLWDHDDDRVDLNTADHEALQRLPGVGPVAAQRIIDERAAGGPFESVEALTRVPGFGPAKVRVLAPQARV